MIKGVKTLLGLIVIAIYFVSFTQESYAGEYGDYSYYVNQDGISATIEQYKGDATQVIIPSTVDGYTVTGLSSYAFAYSTSIENVFIPETILEIGSSAFIRCPNLVKIKVDENNETFDSRNGCNAIIRTKDNTLVTGCKTTKIPEGIERIGSGAYSECNGIETITIPSGVYEIGEYAFSRCDNLKSVVLPDTVITIKSNAFSICPVLEHVNVPKALTDMDEYAFYACPMLKNAAEFYPDDNLVVKVEYKPHTPFETNKGHWRNIDDKAVPMQNEETNIWYEYTAPKMTRGDVITLYYYDGTTKDIYINPDGEQQNEEMANMSSRLMWREIQSLELQFKPGETHDLYIAYRNKKVTEEGIIYEINEVQSNNIPVKILNFPNSVLINGIQYKNYGSNPFASADRIMDVNAMGSDVILPGYVTIDGIKCTVETIYCFNNCATLKSVKVPKTISYLTESAFENCVNLTKVDLPKTLTHIEHGAFRGCTSLTNITIPDSVVEIEPYAFYNTGLKSITLPKDIKKIGRVSLGYHSKGYDKDNYDELKVKGFKIYSGLNTVGTRYAIENGFAPKSVLNWIKKARKFKTSIKAKALNSGKVKLKFRKIKDADGYTIYRATKKNGKYKSVKTLKKSASSKFTDKKLRKGLKYYYKIKAYKNIGKKKYYGKDSKILSAKL